MFVVSTYKGYLRCSKWCLLMVTHARMHGTLWSPNGTYTSPFQGLSEDSRTPLRFKSAIGEECVYAVQIRNPSGVPKEKNHPASCCRISLATCQKPHQDTRGRWAHNGAVHHRAFQLLKHKHYNTEHCGTQPYVSDEYILKTISNEHLPHFVASPLLDSIAELMPHLVYMLLVYEWICIVRHWYVNEIVYSMPLIYEEHKICLFLKMMLIQYQKTKITLKK